MLLVLTNINFVNDFKSRRKGNSIVGLTAKHCNPKEKKNKHQTKQQQQNANDKHSNNNCQDWFELMFKNQVDAFQNVNSSDIDFYILTNRQLCLKQYSLCYLLVYSGTSYLNSVLPMNTNVLRLYILAKRGVLWHGTLHHLVSWFVFLYFDWIWILISFEFFSKITLF